MFEAVLKNRALRQAAEYLSPGRTARLAGVWGSSAALVAAAIARITGRTMLFITAHLDEADELADDVEVLTGSPARLFPAWEADIATEHLNDEVAGERLRLLNELMQARRTAAADPKTRPLKNSKLNHKGHQEHEEMPPNTGLCDLRALCGEVFQTSQSEIQSPKPPGQLVVAPVMALLQPVPAPEALSRSRIVLRKGQALDPDELVRQLVDAGFEHVEQVDQQGEFARRGGIVDIFPIASFKAVRAEFFGDQVESIRLFDLDTQRSTDELDAFDILAVAPSEQAAGRTHLLSYLPDDAIVCMLEPGGVMDLAREIHRRLTDPQRLAAMREAGDADGWDEPSSGVERIESPPAGQVLGALRPFDPDELFLQFSRFALLEMHTFAGRHDEGRETNLGIRSLVRLSVNTHEALEELTELAGVATVWVYCENQAEQKRFGELLAAQHPALAGAARTAVGHVQAGFYWPAENLVVVGHHEVFHRYAKVRRIRTVRAGRPIESLLDLREGDHVVHVTHGIARFQGLRILQREGRSEEYLRLQFADNAVLHVPASSINLVQKYIGAKGKRPSLSHLGGSGWLKAKQRVAAAVEDMAAELLRIQAMRQSMPGISYPAGTEMQRQFEEEFIYEETEDQLITMRQVDDDMARPRPMDRLLCGDVGYGKTELAMRAAFKTVEGGKQVAVLVPTTVLADQHYRTFGERFADYPVRVEVISRFRKRPEQAEIIKRLTTGQIDILIGTHRLLSKDVAFADLGLVVIDEEQRFGVKHKERLKAMRATVDVLTMTATPIPRTLHMAMLGLRDISSLTTPPLDRRAIYTEVRHYDDDFVRQAISRELNRQGQVFFVHNRVMDIEPLAERIRSLVPDARVEVAHGQMPEGQLEKTMLRFVNRRIDVLVCTTIIESGLDIPTANTIIIHNADRFGLAELHQLRGRVGRYKHRAYCYLLLPETRPVSGDAAKRLKAVEDFSDLGAGFQIAMRDLEIRGAGNILGPEQSGHIAAVGYELYCQLLDKAVRQTRGEPMPIRHEVHIELGVEALLPKNYVPSERQRMEVYRRIIACSSAEDLRQLAADLADAYGPVPPAAQALLDLAEMRFRAGNLGIESIIRMEPDIIFSVRNMSQARPLFEGAKGSVRMPDEKTVHWRPPAAYHETPTLIRVLLGRLRQAGQPHPSAAASRGESPDRPRRKARPAN